MRAKHFQAWMTLQAVMVVAGLVAVLGGPATQLTLFQKTNYKGAELGVIFSTACFDLPTQWRARASSIRTNARTQCVLMYEVANCSGPNISIHNSTPNLGQWSNRVGSLSSCRQKESSTSTSIPTILSTNKPPPLSPHVSGATSHLEAGNKIHNILRSKHESPPLQLDQRVVNSAQKCADYLATTNQFGHICKSSGLGENLWGGWGEISMNDSSLIIRAVEQWYAEVEKYDWAKPVVSSRTGHFTQVVWFGSRVLGIGIARNVKERSVIVVAQYDPPGNQNSAAQLEKNVRKPKGELVIRSQDLEEDPVLFTKIL